MLEHLEHLVDPDFDLPADAPAMAVVDAQVQTLDWMGELAARDAALPVNPNAADLARRAFASVTDPQTLPALAHSHVLALRAPEAVRHLVGMLTQYDHDFLEQAGEIRGYVTAKIMEETQKENQGDARIRLRALELLGKLSGVDAFTERVEITHKNEEVGVIEDRIRARLRSMLPPTQEIQDVEVQSVAIVAKPAAGSQTTPPAPA